MMDYVLYNNTPPQKWTESLPVGNGRMGLTMMAGVGCEVLHLNEETVWSSVPNGGATPKLAERLAAVRELLLAGKPREAEALANESLGDCYARIRSYESAGQLKLRMHGDDFCRNYASRIDLMRGIATVGYDKDGGRYRRECFASYPDDVMVYRTTVEGAPFDATLLYERIGTLSVRVEDNTLTALAQTVFGEHKFCVKVRAVTDGTVAPEGETLRVTGARVLTLYITVDTEYRAGDAYTAKMPDFADYEVLKARHVRDFASLMERSEIVLPETAGLADLPITLRKSYAKISSMRDGGAFMLHWQFGRYMLVSSSRPGTLPANLQGLWTEDVLSPWNSDYHTNVNLQCNYWLAEVANLAECHLPLFDYMNEVLLPSGKETASVGYGVRGCVVHHLSDLYGYTAPADGLWGIWPHGASWLALHMWEHYLYGGDVEFLRRDAYPFIREAALFFLDYMVEDADGTLLMGPSMSPENRYYVTDGNGERSMGYLTLSATMDTGIIGELLRFYRKASEILGVCDADTERADAALSKLPPYRIGRHGQLMEWREDYEELDPRHRHLSPAFGLFPGTSITRATPDILQGASVMLDRRFKDYGGVSGTGWTLTWSVALYARLRRGNDAYRNLSYFVNYHTGKNMWDIINIPTYGGDVFQIDGVLACTAAMCEMLLQSHEGVISLLPALPDAWDYGALRGLRARGGFTLDVTWEAHKVTRITLYGVGECTVELPAGQTVATFRGDNGALYTTTDGTLSLFISDTLMLTLEQ